MVRLGILAATLVLAGCGGGSNATARLVADCKADGQATDQQCQCMAENIVKNLGDDTVNKMMAMQEAEKNGTPSSVELSMEEQMKAMTGVMQAVQNCDVQGLM
jgi:hypothetical protein